MDSKKGIALMADYVFLSKYAQKKEDGSLETQQLVQRMGLENQLAQKYTINAIINRSINCRGN